MRPKNHEDVKRMAKEMGWTVDHLLGCDRRNDPFYASLPCRAKEAEWFRSLWDSFDRPNTTHLRRFHYLIVSSGRDIFMSDGSPYENRFRCWSNLQRASGDARHLGLIDPESIEDNRNPDPLIHAEYDGVPSETWWNIQEPEGWTLPSIRADLVSQVYLSMPKPEVGGYEYSQADQPYHLEVWIEKSTMNDILDPICRQLHINLVPGLGFTSITALIALLKRIQHVRDMIGTHKPARIFYISDYDPAGVTMPIAAARQLEFYRDTYAPGADIKLTPLAITEEQVHAYDLPRIPIKDEHLRKGKFEDRRGEGAVELDALEALFPGELRRMVRAAFHPYLDDSLASRLADAEGEAQQAAEDAWGEATEAEDRERAAIEEEARQICQRFEERAAELNGELQAELAPLKERLSTLRRAITSIGSHLSVDLPCRPDAEVDVVEEEEDGWLYDSSRDYLEQAAVYRKFKKDSSDLGGTERTCGAPGCDNRFKTRNPTKEPYCSPACRKAGKKRIQDEKNRRYRDKQKAKQKTPAKK
jgi:hypothetical protein